jgi:hypothetical protein
MDTKPDWNALSHTDKLRVLRTYSIDQIVADYSSTDPDQTAFRSRLAREVALWQPHESDGVPNVTGEPPNKEVVLGAWRDLDRSEALLELIDNSIDAWNRRRSRYPDKAAPELNIYIDIDSQSGQLTYEDNAGGVPTDKLVNLVVPGHSETDALAPSIGSYKTGGKKAIFRLATAVNITTKFWNPAETGDTAIAVHLDEHWLTDVNEYKFPYFELNDGDIQRGQTRYVMQLRPEPIGATWFSNPAEFEKMAGYIRSTYGLLIARHGAINIYFPKRGTKISPALDDIYDFSGTHDGKIDIRPQQVQFETELEYAGQRHKIAVEVVIGCRRTTATRNGLGPGFDLYGNNRLFTSRDNRLFADMLPKGAVSGFIRGWVNILGPNVFVPWDTHKRHLNYDRDVIELIRTHPAIKNLFENWGEAFKQIQGLGKGEITKTVDASYAITSAKTGRPAFAHSATVRIDATRKRGQKLPEDIFKPRVVTATKAKKDLGVTVNILFTTDEARRLAARLQVSGPLDAPQTRKNLGERAREQLLSLIEPRRSRR